MKFESIREKLQEFPPDLFKNHDIVVLAETAHGQHDQTILKFLDQFLKQINTVFIELPRNYQLAVDEYLDKGQINEALENLFAGAENEGKNIRGLLNIFDKINAEHKKIVCFDSSKTQEGEYQSPSKYGKYFLRGKSRDDDMFTVLKENMEDDSGKYLLISGANHSELGEHPQSSDITLGQRLHDSFGEKFTCLKMEKV